MTDSRTPDLDNLADDAATADATGATSAAADTSTVDNTAADVKPSEGPAAASAAAAAPADPLAEAQQALAEQQDKYLRLAAEYDNFRKRSFRDRQDAEKLGMGAVMKGLLETLDDLGRVVHMTPDGTDLSQVLDGLTMVEKKLLKSLAGHGLEVVDPAGAMFDPALHEAITTAPAATPDEDHQVAVVYQVGYVLNGTLLRPARVVVKQWNG